MKQQHVWFICEYCDEESSAESTAKAARATARDEGWLLARNSLVEADVCPGCIGHHEAVLAS